MDGARSQPPPGQGHPALLRHTSLTICSVSYESKGWLDLGWTLATQLNPAHRLRWLVAENSPASSEEKLLGSDERFEVTPGARSPVVPVAPASYHHGASLNLLLPRVTTRYLAVLDPDYFILRRGWVDDVLGHLEATGVALFGSPWHPSRTKMFRYFPGPHCLFIDLERVPRDALDFLPDEINRPRPAKTALSRLDPLQLRRRRLVGVARDTGWRVYQALRESSLSVECVTPVYRPSPVATWLEAWFPEHRSFVPKKTTSFTRRGFREAGWPDLDGLGWEEFMWRGEPFGFHVKSWEKRSSPGLLEQHQELAHATIRRLLDRHEAGSTGPSKRA